MMHKTKTNRWMRLAYLLCVPVLICTMCLCSNPASKKSDELRFDGLSVTALTPEVKSEFSDFTSVEFDEFIETCGTEAQYIVVQIQPCEDEEVIKRFQDYLRENDIFLFNNLIPDQEVYNPQADGNKDALHFQQVEVNPTFQGGDANTFSRWVNQNLVYPYNCKQAGIQGRVTLTFTVNKEGQVCDIKVLRGVCEALDMEAVRVLKSSPAWTPGMAEGEPVNVTYTIPVIFRLTE